MEDRSAEEDKKLLAEAEQKIKKDEERVASFVTLSNGKDMEIIRARKRIRELEGRVSYLEGRVSYLEEQAEPVFRFERSFPGKVLWKIKSKLKRK